MTQRQDRTKPKTPALQPDAEAAPTGAALTDAALDRVSGGTDATSSTTSTSTSNLMKTKHDTVKNSISNIR
jgi:hypothetical protein